MIQPDSPPCERSQQVRQRLHALGKASNENRLEQAELFSLLEREGFWQDWGHRSLAECIGKEFGLGVRSTQLLIRFHRTFMEQLRLSPERVRQLEWSKAVLVTKVLTPENADAILQDVERLSCRELKRKYQRPKVEPSVVGPAITSELSAANATGSVIWWKRPKPSGERFYCKDAVWDQVCYAVAHGINALLKGPTGCGKTEICALVAQAFGRELVRFNCGAMTEARSALIGNTHLDRETGTLFKASRFIAAGQKPYTVLLLDEFSRAPRDAGNILFTALDTQRYLAIDESADGAVIHIAKGVTFLATANLGAAYTFADQSIDEALLNRFDVVIEVDFPPAAQEAAILCARCTGLTEAHAKHLIRFANRQRDLAREGEFTGMISTRTLLAAGRQVAAGVTMTDAIEFCVLNRFASDGGDVGERAKLLQILQKLAA